MLYTNRISTVPLHVLSPHLPVSSPRKKNEKSYTRDRKLFSSTIIWSRSKIGDQLGDRTFVIVKCLFWNQIDYSLKRLGFSQNFIQGSQIILSDLYLSLKVYSFSQQQTFYPLLVCTTLENRISCSFQTWNCFVLPFFFHTFQPCDANRSNVVEPKKVFKGEGFVGKFPWQRYQHHTTLKVG